MTLLQICQAAADNAGVNKPTSIIGSTDPAAVRLLQLARREARFLAEKCNWTALTVERVFIANGTSDYTLPSDYRSLVSDTLWDRSRFWQMSGATSPQEWQAYKSSTFATASIERRWRIRLPSGAATGASTKFSIVPAISSTDTTSVFVCEYVSNNWCRSATTYGAANVAVAAGGTGAAIGNTWTLTGGTFTTAAVLVATAVSSGVVTSAEITTPGIYTVAPTNPVSFSATSGSGVGQTFTMTFAGRTLPDWAADTDTAIIDEDLIEMGVLWRLLRRLGMAYDEEKDEWQRRLDMAIVRDGGTAVLDLSPSYEFPGYANIPDGNWPTG